MMSFFMVYILYIIFQSVFIKVFKNIIGKKIEISKKKTILIVLVGSLINVLLHEYTVPTFDAIFSYVYFLFLIKYMFKLTVKDAIFYDLIVWMVGLILDMLIMNSIKIIDSENIYFNTNISKALCSIMQQVALYLISINKTFRKKIDKLHRVLNKKIFSAIKIGIFISLYIILDGLCLYYIDVKNIGITIFFIASSLIFITSLTIYYLYKITTIKETNELLIKNNVQLEISLTDYRVIKHNIRNKLLGIKAVANQKTKALIDDMLKEYSDNNDDYDITNVPSGLNGIIYEKIAMYKEENLNITTINHIDEHILEKITPKSYNLLCEALGVVLDNAMEAAKESEDKIVYLHFTEVEDQIKIKVMNTYTGIIDIEKLGTINYTSKKKGHGIGLFSLIEKKKLDIRNSLKNNFFITNIAINKLEQ